MKIKYVFILFVALIIGVNYIDGADKFPDKITLYRHVDYSRGYSDPSGIKYGNNRIVDKTYEGYVGSKKYSGRAFCTSWKYSVPKYYLNCEKAAWSSDSTLNEKISASIGQFILGLRDENGISDRNYFYGEMAINDFLYNLDRNIYASSNIRNTFYSYNLSISDEYRKKIDNYYNNYDTSSIKITSIKVNNQDITKNSVIKKNTNGYKMVVALECSDIKCDNISPKHVKINEQSLSYELKNNNDKTALITVYIPNELIKETENNYNILIDNVKKVYNAQRYTCDKNGTQYRTKYQLVVPNLIVPETKKYNPVEKSGTFTINGIPDSCATSVSSDPVKNAELYKDNHSKSDYGNLLLDSDNPSCNNIENKNSFTCENETNIINYKWVNDKVNIDGVNRYEMCTATFEFNNDTLNDKIASSTGTVYKGVKVNEDGKYVVGTGKVTYRCDVPELYNSSVAAYSVAEKQVNIIPKLKIVKFNNESINIETKLNKVYSIVDKNGDDQELCSKNADNSISCNYYVGNDNSIIYANNKKLKGFGWYFVATFDYLYPKDTNGVDVADINESGELNFKFNYDDTIFKDINISESSNCTFSISNNPKKEVLYRTIDYNKPFLKYNGDIRPTGSNWCGYGDDSSEDVKQGVIIETESANKPIQSCPLYGDTNNDYILNDADVNEVSKMFAYEYPYNILYDLDNSGIIDTNDWTLFQKIIRDQDDVCNIPREYIEIPDSVTCDAVNKNIIDCANHYGRLVNSNIDSNNEVADYNDSNDESGFNGCGNNNVVVKQYITNRANADGKYKGKSVEAGYHFVLDAKTIKAIRNYKNNGEYINSAENFLSQIDIEKSGLCINDIKNCKLEDKWENVGD